jgi:serine/threonine protein phosphatase PrpC
MHHNLIFFDMTLYALQSAQNIHPHILRLPHRKLNCNFLLQVEAKGGEVSLSPLGGVYRVDKRLNMSRAFGDYTIKQHLSVAPDIWDNCLTEQDDFFIVASDGLWKVMNSQEAVDQVQAEDTAEAAAKALAASALRRGSRDDISCLVICLKAPRVNSTNRCL